MARGAEGKAEQKKKKKEARAAAAEASKVLGDENGDVYNEFATMDANEIMGEESPVVADGTAAKLASIKSKKTKKKLAAAGKKKPVVESDDDDDDDNTRAKHPTPASKQGIKTTPLILLILLTGTTLLPAMLYAGDWLGAFVQKNHILGSIGHKLGIGPNPKKRVLSFYEKHDPTKLDEVPNIMAKYYGDYPKLIKKLERKYGDYGYFLNWEEDEAPLTLAKEKLMDTKMELEKLFQKHAPQVVKTGVRNARYNIGFIYKKGNRLWKKHVWPHLEPFLGVPKGGAAQKRKDAQQARSRPGGKPRRKTDSFRDEDDEM